MAHSSQNLIEIVVRATDRASVVIKRVSHNMKTTLGSVDRMIERSATRASAVSTKALNLVSRAAGVVARAVRRIAVAATLVGGALVATAGKALAVSSRFETFTAKLTTAFKSPLVAVQKLREAMAFATTTPFEVGEVVDAFVRLKFYGLDTSKWMVRLGNMAGSMGKRFTDAVEAIADALSGGGLERMKEFGIGYAALVKAGARQAPGGGILTATAADVAALERALARLMDQRFGGGMERAMNTVQGKVSNLKDTLTRGWLRLGQSLSPAFGMLLDATATVATRMEGVITRYASQIASVAMGATRRLMGGLNALIERAPVLWRQLAQVGRTMAGWARNLPTFDQVRTKLEALMDWLTQMRDHARRALHNLLGPDPLRSIMAFTRSAGRLLRDFGSVILDIGRNLAPILRAVLQQVARFATKLREWWDGLGEGARRFAINVGLASFAVAKLSPALLLLASPVSRLVGFVWRGVRAWRAWRIAAAAAAATRLPSMVVQTFAGTTLARGAAGAAAAGGIGATGRAMIAGAVAKVTGALSVGAVGVTAAIAGITAALAGVAFAVWAGVQTIRLKAEQAAAERGWRAVKAMEARAGQTGAERRGHDLRFGTAFKEVYGPGGTFWGGKGRGGFEGMEITAGRRTPEAEAALAARRRAERMARIPQLVPPQPASPPTFSRGFRRPPPTPLRYAVPNVNVPTPGAAAAAGGGRVVITNLQQVIRLPDMTVKIEPDGGYTRDYARYGGR